MRITKLINKLEKTYIPNVSSYSIKYNINVILKEMFIDHDLNLIDMDEEEIDCLKSADSCLGFRITHCCEKVEVNYIVVWKDELDMKIDKIITTSELSVLHKSKIYRDLQEINLIGYWKDSEKKISALNKISQDISEGLVLCEDEDIFYKGIQAELKYTIIIDNYNTRISEIAKNNEFAKKAKEILREISEEDCFGHMEIVMPNEREFEELLIQLHLDYGSFIQGSTNIFHEGANIFCDVGISSENKTFFNIGKSNEIVQQLEKAVDKCVVIPATYEISDDGSFKYNADDPDNRYYSITEFECAIIRQSKMVELNQDDIFKNLWKLLLILKTEIDLLS